MTCIYTILSPTKKVYVGQTVDFTRRVSCYKGLHCKTQSKLYNSLQKHRWDAHKCRPVIYLSDNASPETLTYWEQFVMDFYKEQGYTLLNLREAGSRGEPSNESKEKMRKARLGRKLSPETRSKISLSGRGRKLTEESRRKISSANKGKVRSNEAKHRMRLAHLGKTPSSTTREKLRIKSSGESNPAFRGHILAYKNDELIGAFVGSYDAAKKLGISQTLVLKGIKRTTPLKESGYRLVRISSKKF